MLTVENITNPGADPVDGDWIRILNSANSSVTKKHYRKPSPERAARKWRDSELERTDIIAQTSDWPNRDAWLTYRTILRDWPASEDFPDTRPNDPDYVEPEEAEE